MPDETLSSLRKRTPDQKAADALTTWAGSWTFLIVLTVGIVIWITGNVLGYLNQWDPYPFILLNLMLSFMAAYQAPVILMSQNRMAEHDRAKAHLDLSIDRKAEREIQDIQKDLEEIKTLLRDLKKERPNN